MSTSLPSHGRRGVALLAGMGLTLSSLALASTTITAGAADEAGSARAITFTATTKALSAGQYQIAASDETNELFTSSAVGRPPVVTGTISKVDPVTLEVKAQAQLPVVKHSNGTHRLVSTHGIDVDDSRDEVWVTNTRDNQVSVYDRDTLAHKWSTYTANYSVDPGTGNGVMAQEMNHPREVEVDETRKRAYVSGANRGGSGEGVIAVYNTETRERLADIVIPVRENYPTQGVPANPVPMALEIDESTGTIYSNDMRTDRVYKITPDGVVTSWDIPNPTVGGEFEAVAASGLDIDVDSKRLYSANQNTGDLDVFNLETGAPVAKVKTGNQALAVAVDDLRDLVYVADFNNGSVAVVDGRTNTVLETIQPQGVTAQANHITVHNGSAYMVDKFAGAAADVPYSVNPTTGERASANVALNAITKITPSAEVTVAASAAVGGKLAIKGEGFLTKDGTAGSKVAVKIEQADSLDSFSHVEGHTVHTNATIWALVQADSHGVIDTQVALPDGTTAGANGSTVAFTPGSYGARLLSGSLLAGDTPRSFKIPFAATDAVPTLSGVAVAGTAKVGAKLTARATVAPAGAAVSYQWLRNGVAIAGAKSVSYTASVADFNTSLSVKVSALNGAASASVTSKAVKVGAASAKAGTVKITGKAKVGKTLKVKTSKWAAGTKLSYKWTVGGKTVKGATTSKIKVKKSWKGKKVTVKVTGKKTGYVTVAKSAKTAKVKK